MTVTSDLSPAPVIGDGTTSRSRAGSRWRRARWPLAIVGLVLLVGLLAALPAPRTSTVALAPDNPSALGSRALAEVLRDQGVEITYVRSSAAALEAAGAGSTLLVTSDAMLSDEQAGQIAASEADLVLVEPVWLLPFVTSAADTTPEYAPSQVRTAECADPDARAAGTVTVSGSGFIALDDDATTCFPAPGGESGGGAYLVVEGERRVTAISDGTPLTNDAITAEGNAALALRMLGRHDHLVWYVPSLADSGEASGPALRDMLPPWAGPVALQLLLVAAVAGVWRARRLGRVVVEPLPVTVRSGEATRGRGRLYRRSRSYGHAAAALRAGVATRTAAQLGLPRSAPAPVVIDALARATGRANDDVAGLLYGPPPTDDTGLALLARRLDELESEVHRT
ncbi:DUF4350 domain-containing protein [Cellulomonas cellasea]|uniref:DUF4350 domain-containing protein n=1 Tax=Cellulomonas cellasea TaxID=43670 RepID=UPI0025A3D2C0|nr:DUF4350 domain-containing protein [Cellulomonas cellasea]MDM8083858.1 DUF4350 domain-containing protein [Cellulomonas cellasea]